MSLEDKPVHDRSGAVLVVVAAVLLLIIIFYLCRCVHTRGDLPVTINYGGVGGSGERVILLLADRLTYGDLRRAAGPNLARLMNRGAVALMNVRTGRTGSESGYLSLGTGSRAVAGSEGRDAFEEGEIFEGECAETVFERRTGKKPAGNVFHPGAAMLQEKNKVLPYPVAVGLLGDNLAERGLTAAVWGNADGAVPNRSAVMVAMNSGGAVSTGKLGDGLVLEDNLYPYGMRTDTPGLAAAVTENIAAAELHVVEFGDSSRLDDYWFHLTPSRGEALFRKSMENLDLLIGELVPLVEECGCSLLLATPSLPLNRPAGGEQLAPLLLFAPAGPGPGLLISASTRRPGLVQNTDLLSMICSLAAGAGKGDSFQPVRSYGIIPQKNSLDYLDHFSRQAMLVFDQRPLLLKGYVTFLVVLLLAALAALLLKIRALLHPLSRIIPMLLFVPPALLLLPGLFSFPRSETWQSSILLLGAAVLPALLLHPLQKKNSHIYWTLIGWGTALALLIDTAAGAPLQQLSLLGYDPIGGARYYGMGNEYMGVLIGSALLGTVSLKALLLRRAKIRRWKILFTLPAAAAALLYGATIFILAAPNYGANLGGTLAAATAFGVAWAEISGAGEEKKKGALSLIAFLVLAAGLLWLLNTCLPQSLPSHVGLFGEAIRTRGPAAFWETAWRKMSMNIKLVRYSIWGRALVTLVGLCAVLFLYPGGLRRRLRRELPDLVTGLSAGLAGATAALLTNDSGVVAAATILLYTVPPALLTMMQKSCSTGQDIDGAGQD